MVTLIPVEHQSCEQRSGGGQGQREEGQRKREGGEKGKGGVKNGTGRKRNKAELLFPERVGCVKLISSILGVCWSLVVQLVTRSAVGHS